MQKNAKIKKYMARLTFWQIFRQIDPNTLEVLRKLKVGAIEFDAGATITKGTVVAGIDFFNYLGSEIEGDEEGDVWVVKRIYAQNG
jgi:hypothetical protein